MGTISRPGGRGRHSSSGRSLVSIRNRESLPKSPRAAKKAVQEGVKEKQDVKVASSTEVMFGLVLLGSSQIDVGNTISDGICSNCLVLIDLQETLSENISLFNVSLVRKEYADFVSDYWLNQKWNLSDADVKNLPDE